MSTTQPLFITGTDTNVGKTLVSSWVCLHTRRPYWKPIQTGTCEGFDSHTVSKLSGVQIYPERYAFEKPLSPHAACGEVEITLESLTPPAEGLVIEGAGGVYVPLNKKHFLIDWVAQHGFPTLVVARSTLGTINHTLLTLQTLRSFQISIVGVVMNGPLNPLNRQAIEDYGQVSILAEIPLADEVTSSFLKSIPCPLVVD